MSSRHVPVFVITTRGDGSWGPAVHAYLLRSETGGDPKLLPVIPYESGRRFHGWKPSGTCCPRITKSVARWRRRERPHASPRTEPLLQQATRVIHLLV